ncbi:DUF1700 domain-containing protein [Erysipelotrichaceae bacterium HCN-30851]
MSKEEFLRVLERKLDVINEKERKDIIDEYRTHIEMKMQEGKTEEEVIQDFGDIDELVEEILDAYKINTQRVNQSFDAKLNKVLDSLFESFQGFLGSLTSLDVDDVVRLVFEILVILILLSLLHIPFRIISSIGSSLLHSVGGYGIGSLLAMVWRFIIGLAFVVIFVVVLINLCSKRLSRYRKVHKNNEQGNVFEDFKESFDFEKAKETVHSFSNKEDTAQTNDEEEIKWEEEPKKKEQSQGNKIITLISHLLFFILMIPCVMVIVGLCCVLGVMIVFSFEGVTLIGAYFMTIGGLIVISGCLSLLHRVLWRRG